MASEMIEKVARAMCVADGEDPDRTIANHMSSKATPTLFWMCFVDQAEAAIEALMEPTDEMVSEGRSMVPNSDYNEIVDAFQAMLKAALNPTDIGGSDNEISV